jgi:hypothetical protein
MNLNDFTLQRNMIVDDFHDLFPLPVLAFIFSGKRTPKWIQKATKIGPQITKKVIFEIFGRSGRYCFFKVFGNQKDQPKIWKKVSEGAHRRQK